jgi:hypothetical protein
MIAWLRDSTRTMLKVDFVQRVAPDLRAAGNPTLQTVDAPTSLAQDGAAEQICAAVMQWLDTE